MLPASPTVAVYKLYCLNNDAHIGTVKHQHNELFNCLISISIICSYDGGEWGHICMHSYLHYYLKEHTTIFTNTAVA